MIRFKGELPGRWIPERSREDSNLLPRRGPRLAGECGNLYRLRLQEQLRACRLRHREDDLVVR